MKSKIAVVIILLAVLGAMFLWGMPLFCGSGCTYLVPAWQLTPEAAYDGQSIWDPVVSWSPDSKSLLLAISGPKYTQWILRWNVGGKQITKVTQGMSPNYIDRDRFIFLLHNPARIVEYTLSTGTQRTIVNDLKHLEFWKDLSSFTYSPDTKTIALRFATFTRYYEPGAMAIDLKGKFVGKVPRETGNGILARSADPSGRRVAELLGELTAGPRTLRIDGKDVATGDFGAVAWSPDGRVVAYSEANEVNLVGPDGRDTLTIARLGAIPISGPAPYVCRLIWSPDSKYLAVVELVPGAIGGHVVAYVLDVTVPEAMRRW